MLKNYFIIACRNLKKQKGFTFINLTGLAIGIASTIIILLWVQNELSYDQFHEKAGRIYRIERELFRDNAYSRWPITSGGYKQALIDDYPEIESAVRFWRREFAIKDHRNITHRQGMIAVDNSIFEIFDFNLEKGDKKTALIKPKSVVLTRDNALKYFGTDDVIGRSLSFEWEGEPVDFEITGIINEVPRNSHVHFDMLLSISSYSNERFGSIRSNYLYTYILAGENTSRIDLEEKLTTFVSKRLEPYYGDLLSQGLGIHEVLKIHLFPITDIHLHPSPNWEIGVGGSMASVYIFFSIAVLILIIACINFMNLSTASASKRAKEITLRKTIGANSNQLRVQFIQESLVLAILALIFALVLISFFIPAYNSIFNEELSTHTLFTFTNLIFLIGMTLLVGLLSGLYPAFYLTKFDPISTLKGGVQSGSGKSIFRRAMVVIQFAISITLIIGTLVAHQQMNYMQTKSLGFNKENVILIPVRSQRVAQNFQNYRNELVNLAQIQSVSVSSDLPGENFYSNTNFLAKEQSNNPVSLIILATDFDFIDTYRMDLVTGRIFSKEISSDTSGTLMLNEAAIHRFGWTAGEAIGKELSYSGQITGKIVGVVKDFNFRSLHTEIEPLALILNPNYFRSISVRIQPGNIQNAISIIQQKWESSFPGEVFEFSFLDNRMNQLYENEMKMQNIFIIFSCFSVLIACLGLFGLSVFIAAERTKEIGIRKVLGASMSKIILLLSKEFITWVLIANIVAWPLAWFIMTKWLQNFAYKIELSWWIFGGAGVVALSIALLTVSVQAIKAATANPIESLKYE